MISYILTFILYTAILILVPFFVDKTCKKKNIRQKNIKLLFIAIVCGLIAAFRGKAGTDSLMYINAYTLGVDSISRWVDFEIGFSFVVKVLNLLHLPYQAMFFVFSFIATFMCLKAIDLESDMINVKIATLIYITDLYFWGFNGIRQMIAISVCLMGIALYLKNKKIIALFFIFIATFFHRTAIMVFAIVFICIIYKSKYKKQLFTFGIFLLLILIMRRDFLGKIVQNITGNTYYSGYITRDAETNSSLFNYYIKLSPLFVLPIMIWRKVTHERKIFIYFTLMIIGLVLSSLGAVTATQISRVGMYFSMCKIFVIGYCSNYRLPIRFGYRIYGKDLTQYFVVIYFCFLFYYNYFIRGFSLLVPYGLFS